MAEEDAAPRFTGRGGGVGEGEEGEEEGGEGGDVHFWWGCIYESWEILPVTVTVTGFW